MNLTIRERKKEMINQYNIIHKNLRIKFSKTDNIVEDELTGHKYIPSVNSERIKLKKIRTIIQLIDLYRKDFPEDWKKYLSYTFRENMREESYQLLLEKDLSEFELLIKIYWVRRMNRYIYNNILPDKRLEEIDKLISFNEFMVKVISNILYVKKQQSGWEGISLLHVKRMLNEKHKLDFYFDDLVKKYHVDINDSSFVPENTLDFMKWD